MSDDPRAWIVWCEVRGGATGSRAGPLRSMGEVVRFDTKEQAEAEAAALEAKMNGPRAIAAFRYRAVRDNGW